MQPAGRLDRDCQGFSAGLFSVAVKSQRLLTVLVCCALFAFGEPSRGRAQVTNLVANGSFEQSRSGAAGPADWAAAGNPAVKQHLGFDIGRDGQRCAKLECTQFIGDGPDFHAMICQVGKVSARQGQWYRLSFWARAQGLKSGAIEVALVNTRPWENVGLAEAGSVSAEWERFDWLFRAKSDLPAEASRLQIWFKGTGTLWLDDVELTASENRPEWFPQIATEGVKNFVPNSSFECGTANWGSYTYGLGGWSSHLYQLVGELDDSTALHGNHSFKIALKPQTAPIFYADYYQPVREPVRRVLVANRGWFRVRPGERLTLSAFLRADRERITAQLAAIEAPSHLVRQNVLVSTNWQRYQYSFAPTQAFVFIAVGLDLVGTEYQSAVLWLDSVQLERGAAATAYQPRQPLESFVETGVTGNIFTNLDRGLACTVRAFNDSAALQPLRGELELTDFFDRRAFAKSLALEVRPHSGASRGVEAICPGQQGFFRARWTSQTSTQSLRCALLAPAPAHVAASPFGFNHAYPWDFLVRLARQAGVVWWRDWSAKWETVESVPGKFAFQVPDVQIQRVLNLDSQVEVLLPFPSANWSSTARREEVDKAAGSDRYLRTRLPVAYAPKDLADFGRYAAEVVRHYQSARPQPVTTYQVLNEPVYTSYALPRQFGYSLQDYLRLLETASRAMKSADPQCRIVGGLSAGLESAYTRDFVNQGGLRLVDVFDLHLYDPPRPAESYEEPFSTLEELMRSHGGPKPVWITEWGCYADDEPACLPQTVGDATMNRCRWRSERAATEYLVKFTAVAFAHGVRQIYFHAGTCGALNGPDAAGVLFAYGGAPRKMYAGVAALSHLLAVPDKFLDKIERDGLLAYLFQTRGQVVGIVWGSASSPQTLAPNPQIVVRDIMGNRLGAPKVIVSDSPIYLVASNARTLVEALSSHR